MPAISLNHPSVNEGDHAIAKSNAKRAVGSQSPFSE